ncbi:MAG TPA: hypothetical protein DIC24_00195 [Gammaproteobacteria bacterium]|nr:hypothetical protein [Gammaproteobacteria bacterium]
MSSRSCTYSGIQKKEIRIDFLYIDSDGLEVIFKLFLSRETANGVLYAKFKKSLRILKSLTMPLE